MSVGEVLHLLKNYWPDNTITKDQLVNPTPEFVFKFYTDLLNDFNEKVVSIINDDNINNAEIIDNPDFPPEFNLFHRTAKFYKRLDINFYLNDILQPVPKRTAMLIMHGIHFVSYTASVIDSYANNLNELFKKADQLSILEAEKQKLLKETNDIAERLAMSDDQHKTLCKAAEDINKNYEIMSEQKATKDKVLAGKNTELKQLKMECENLEYRLQKYEEQEIKLKPTIVSNSDFEALKNMEEYLKNEQEQLTVECDNVNDLLKNQKQGLDYIENCLSLLESLEFNSPNANKLAEYEEELNSLENERNLVENKVNSLNVEIKNGKHNQQMLKEKLESFNQEYEELNKKLMAITQSLRDKYGLKSSDIQKSVGCYQKLERIITNLEENKTVISDDEKLLKETVLDQYNRILNCLRKIVTKFSDMLLAVKEQFIEVAN